MYMQKCLCLRDAFMAVSVVWKYSCIVTSAGYYKQKRIRNCQKKVDVMVLHKSWMKQVNYQSRVSQAYYIILVFTLNQL